MVGLSFLVGNPAGSNRLSSVSDGTNTRGFAYSAAGHVANDNRPGGPNLTLAYNDNNRLVSASDGSTQLAAYTYDALEHRVIKQTFGGGAYTHHFIYDQAGHLIAESDASGTVIREYIWLGGLPVALVDSGNLYFIHADWRGAPQKATGASGTIVWDAQIEPFGAVYAVSGALTQLLKFPGQYHDGETGYEDNWHRTYDPATGRYIQADPLGLAAGVNVYAYAGGNPETYVDPDGQNPLLVAFAVGALIGAGFDVYDQLSQNGWQVSCLNPSKIGVAALSGGALNLAGLGVARLLPELAPVFGRFLADESGTLGARFSSEKEALVDMAQADKKIGLTRADMRAYEDLNRQLSDPFPANKVRIDEGHAGGAPSSQVPHGHVGPVSHIPILDP